MRKLKRLLKKRGVIITANQKEYYRLIRAGKFDKTLNGWFDHSKPYTIFLAKRFGVYKSSDLKRTILHEYRHWFKFHRHWNQPTKIKEADACLFAERARNRF